MPLLNVILIGVGLSLDAIAVAMAGGMAMKKLHLRSIFRTAFFFGLFQAMMPVLGWLAGLGLRRFISGIDHWIAFGLLSFIGCKMVIEAFYLEDAPKKTDTANILVLLTLAVATSIDALAVGLSFSFMKIAIAAPAIIIGLITFALSSAAGFIGYRFGLLFGKKIEILGGLILIGIGLKILLEHLRAP